MCEYREIKYYKPNDYAKLLYKHHGNVSFTPTFTISILLFLIGNQCLHAIQGSSYVLCNLRSFLFA